MRWLVMRSGARKGSPANIFAPRRNKGGHTFTHISRQGFPKFTDSISAGMLRSVDEFVAVKAFPTRLNQQRALRAPNRFKSNHLHTTQISIFQ
jgi:hypothetical protein